MTVDDGGLTSAASAGWGWGGSRAAAGGTVAGGGGVDITPLCVAGVPCAGLRVSNGARDDKTDSYYYDHHTCAGRRGASARGHHAPRLADVRAPR